MCLALFKGYRSRENGQVTTLRKGFYDLPATRPCGQCMECRLKHSREKAMQCEHEKSLHERNTVVTLTYPEEFLPANGSLVVTNTKEGIVGHAETFIKDLRAHEQYRAKKERRPERRFKTYGCGEYGEKRGRPHYHIILFGYDFEDKQLDRHVSGEYNYYTSDILERLWGRESKEHEEQYSTQIMDLTWESAAYVARYITKKLNVSEASPEHIKQLAKMKYEGRLPEQTVCMTQKGLGKEWYNEWKEEMYAGDRVYRNSKDGRRIPMQPPKYYDRRYEIDNKLDYERVKKQRRIKMQNAMDKLEKEINSGKTTNAFNQGIGRRDHSKQVCTEAKLAMLKRGYENGE